MVGNPRTLSNRMRSTPLRDVQFAIDHLGRVLVAFAVRERSGLVARERPAFSLHIVRLPPDGNVGVSLSLAANGWRNNSIYLTDRDQIMVRANDSLQLGSDCRKPIGGSSLCRLRPPACIDFAHAAVRYHGLAKYLRALRRSAELSVDHAATSLQDVQPCGCPERVDPSQIKLFELRDIEYRVGERFDWITT
jgi:hypothetical protein